jgi:TolA-binding protein
VRDTELVGAQDNEPQRFDALAERISALRDRVTALQPRITELAILQQLAVQDLAAAELEQQRLRLADYSSQARFAIAEIYDRATISRDATHAPAK